MAHIQEHLAAWASQSDVGSGGGGYYTGLQQSDKTACSSGLRTSFGRQRAKILHTNTINLFIICVRNKKSFQCSIL